MSWKRLGLACLAAFVLTAVVVPLKWRFNLRREVRRELGLCRAAGEPVTLAELAAWYPPVPDAENAALPLLEIWREDDPEFWDAWLARRRPLPEPRDFEHDDALPIFGGKAGAVGRGQPLTSAQRAAAAVWWWTNEARLARVTAALQRPQMRFPLNWQDHLEPETPHLAALRNEAQRLRLRALLSADLGDAGAALAAIEAGSKLGRLLEAEPKLLSQYALTANRSLTRSAVEEFLNRLRPSPPDLSRLNQAVGWSPAGERHRLALQAERVFNRWSFALPPGQVAAAYASVAESVPEAEPPGKFGILASIRLMRLSGLADADDLLLLQTMRRALAAAEPVHARRAEFVQAFADATNQAQGLPPRLLSGIILESIGKSWDRFARSHAETEMMKLALALERHHLDHGSLPDTLDALIPGYLAAVAEDPFSGQPLRYRRLDHGYAVYSVGPDSVDDGGRVRDFKDKRQQTWDIVFTVERAGLARPGAPPFQRGPVAPRQE